MKDKIILILKEKGTPLPAGTVAKRLILSQSKTNKLLEELVQAGAVDVVRIGKHDFYRAK